MTVVLSALIKPRSAALEEAVEEAEEEDSVAVVNVRIFFAPRHQLSSADDVQTVAVAEEDMVVIAVAEDTVRIDPSGILTIADSYRWRTRRLRWRTRR